jgi:hypothetical protein
VDATVPLEAWSEFERTTVFNSDESL